MNTASHPLSILVADDDPSNREILLDAIKQLYPTAICSEAMNGEQAVEQATQQIDATGANFAVIFMDYQMPLLNGQEATTAVRQYEKANNLGQHQLAYIVTWSAARKSPYDGADNAMSKPLIPDELTVVFDEYKLCKQNAAT